ncbi:MarR family winged helix-turn-helix transcriptional regulator [Oricola indica]|jgi:DNA-binding MarR family transcriptional regulator|uniref:MarR family winged helix-turn-helix transcriptional regulator n=1 Tax=Oricola indica TaxID=2872591 RepID=UPI001CBA7239|nr:MarR family transcriptional regulator [Oricola indica]
MKKTSAFPFESTLEVRDACLCLHLQRAARKVARIFDDAFRPLGITNGQFSLLISLNRPEPPVMGDVAALLALDRTTLTANLKPLERRGLVVVSPDPNDRRSRRLALTAEGEELMNRAYPIWRETHALIDKMIADPDRLRTDLLALS